MSDPADQENTKIISALQLIRRLTRPARKILNFGSDSLIPHSLLSIGDQDALSGGILEHPAIAALVAALCPLVSWRPRNEARQVKADMDYDPMTFGGYSAPNERR